MVHLVCFFAFHVKTDIISLNNARMNIHLVSCTRNLANLCKEKDVISL